MSEQEKEILLADLVNKIDDMNSILYEMNEHLKQQEPMIAYALNKKIVMLQNSITRLKATMIATFRNEGMPSPTIVRKLF